ETIAAAIQQQAAVVDYVPPFQFGYPPAFELASRIAALAPADLNHVFFCNSGSEAVDTALKISIAWQQQRGEGTRTRLIGRQRGDGPGPRCVGGGRGFPGAGSGGTWVGAIATTRRMFGSLLIGVDHLPSTYAREKQAFTKGEPDYGAHFADELERIVGLHGP